MMLYVMLCGKLPFENWRLDTATSHMVAEQVKQATAKQLFRNVAERFFTWRALA